MAARIVPAADGMAEAVARLRSGGIVAFPTETVYGLGADATNVNAVAQIFAAKGRPGTNPLIVHVADADSARALAADWTEAAVALATRFWPGPLTMVVEKTPAIPAIVTAGGHTVGLRVPEHAVALELIRAANVPIAAPSANRSEEVSPTTAEHVAESLGPWVEDLLILDGGPTSVGIESTVVDVTGATPRLLRPGMIDVTAWVTGALTTPLPGNEIVRSPGQQTRHYAPRTPVTLIPNRALARHIAAGDGALAFGMASVWDFAADSVAIRMPTDPMRYAALLYAALRALDERKPARILIELPPESPSWAAIQDRLHRAAGGTSSVAQP